MFIPVVVDFDDRPVADAAYDQRFRNGAEGLGDPLLAIPERLLRLLPLRDVEHDSHDAAHRAVPSVIEGHVDDHVAQRPVGTRQPHLVGELAPLACELEVQHLVRIRKLPWPQVEHGLAQDLAQGVAGTFLERGIAAVVPAFHVLEEDRRLDGVYHDVEKLELVPGLLLGLLEVGDVGEGGVDLVGTILAGTEARDRVDADPPVCVEFRG